MKKLFFLLIAFLSVGNTYSQKFTDLAQNPPMEWYS